MSKIWYCRNCGYEVGSRGRCHQCKEKLIASPLPELAIGDEEDEVGYRLEDWADVARGRLIESLMQGGIEHRFEDDELVVAADNEARVDELVADAADHAGETEEPEVHLVEDLFNPEGKVSETYVPGIGLVDAEGRPVSGSAGRAHFAISTLDTEELQELAIQVHRLHEAAGRLRQDPTDMEADADVAEASAAVFVTDQFPGLGTDTWAAVGRTTRRLLGALGSDEALEEEISRQAGILSALLDVIAEDAAAAQQVAEEQAAAEAAGDRETEAVDGVPAGDAGPFLGSARDEASSAEAADPAGDRDLVETVGLGDQDGESLVEGETVYELPAEWLPEQRAELTVLLDAAGITPVWDRGDLIVPADREGEVEALFDQIHGGQSTADQDEAHYQEISELFAATARLAGDPSDVARSTEVLRTVHAVEGSTPFGFDGVKWSAIRKRAHLLADSIEHKAQGDVVASEATSLRDLLRELV